VAIEEILKIKELCEFRGALGVSAVQRCGCADTGVRLADAVRMGASRRRILRGGAGRCSNGIRKRRAG
jgi:hypothetical protein